MYNLITNSVYQKTISLPDTLSCSLNNSSPEAVVLFFKTKGEIAAKHIVPANVRVTLVKGAIILTAYTETDFAICGTHSKLIESLLAGLQTGFTKLVELRGLGYRATITGNRVEFLLGYSHPAVYELPAGVSAKLLGTKARVIQLTSTNLPLLAQTFAQIRALRPPGVYNERGIYEKYEKARVRAGKKKKFS